VNISNNEIKDDDDNGGGGTHAMVMMMKGGIRSEVFVVEKCVQRDEIL
jgi:hypothetical protein